MKDNKVNVDLIVPSIGEKYNLFIPVNKTIGEVILILNKSINEMTGCFPMVNNLSLMDVMDNRIFEIDRDIKSLGIKNGTTLALI